MIDGGERVAGRKTLGEFEQLLLLAVMRLGDDAYGVTMRREVEARTGREVSLGAIYPTMARLERKGLVSSFGSEPTSERGGRCRRCFRLEPAGRRAIEEARSMVDAMWKGFEEGKAGT